MCVTVLAPAALEVLQAYGSCVRGIYLLGSIAEAKMFCNLFGGRRSPLLQFFSIYSNYFALVSEYNHLLSTICFDFLFGNLDRIECKTLQQR